MRYAQGILRAGLLALILVLSFSTRTLAGPPGSSCASPNAGAVDCHCHGSVLQFWFCSWPTPGWLWMESDQYYQDAIECEIMENDCQL